MDTKKVTKMEMKEHTPAEVHDDENAEKDKMERIREAKKEAEEEEEEAEEEKEEEAHVHYKLKNPTEEIYSLATEPASTTKHNEDVYQKVRLYKRISAVFTILSLLLLAVVLALAMKLFEVQSIQKYPERPEVEKPEEFNCSLQLCQTMYPSTQDVQKHVYRCTVCEKGWLKFENSCYFISKERLTWQESREACQKQGGDLVVINNERVQKHLTQNGGMLYWIGLSYTEKQQWMWINNTAPTQNYWAHGQPVPASQGSCALLRGQFSHKNNWISNRCGVLSQYICQRG